MALAAQHAATGIRVNCVAPGIVDTPMIADYGVERKARLIEAIPMSRLATAHEIATAIEFLLSDAAGYITGQTVDVNGGQFMS